MGPAVRQAVFRSSLAMMFLSGASALALELVWMRFLQRAFGVTVHAVAATVAVYMAGLALGAAFSGRLASRLRPLPVGSGSGTPTRAVLASETPGAGRPLVLYGWLEASIGAAALLSTWMMGRLPDLVGSMAGDAPVPAWARVALSCAALIPPTFLMGATLPVLTRQWGELAGTAGDRVGAAVGGLYGANTAGAAFGLLAAGFWTIGEWGERATVWAAVGLNAAAAALAWWTARRLAGERPGAVEAGGRASAAPSGTALAAAGAVEAGGRASRPPGARSRSETERPLRPQERRGRQGARARWTREAAAICAFTALSGFCSLGYEVLWSRQLVLVLGNSTYAFSTLMLMYLAGIGLGSALCGKLAEEERDPLFVFAVLELGLAAAGALSLAAFRNMALSADSPAYLYAPLQSAGDLPRLALQAGGMVLPASFLMGLLFPLAAHLCARRPAAGAVEAGGRASAAPSGKALAAAGAVEAGDAVGRVYSFNTLGGILGALAAGFWGVAALGTHGAFLALVGLNAATGLAALAWARRQGAAGDLREPAAVVLAGALLAAYAWKDPALEAIVQRLDKRGKTAEVLFHRESPAAMITGVDGPSRDLLINGILTAGTGADGSLMAAVPNLLLDDPASTLVICFGAGNTFRTASLLGGSVHAVDLIGDLYEVMPRFYPDAAAHLGGPGRAVFVDDGRSHLLRSKRTYDEIIVDATPPLYSAGAVNLYTREFLELGRRRLTPDGLLMLWLPSASFEDDYWRIMKAMAEVFPNVAVWNRYGISGLLVFGSMKPLARRPGAVAKRIERRGVGRLLPFLTEKDVEAGFILVDDEVRSFTAPYRAVTDDLPSPEFPLRRFLRGDPLMTSLRFLLKARQRPIPS
ncbi:MAG: hypothetical protein HY927_09635 [Elusimicrobia bacterium]|nr:hypothetical protein [Elusimicrobiota bacterium]